MAWTIYDDAADYDTAILYDGQEMVVATGGDGEGILAWLIMERRQQKRPKRIEMKRPIKRLPVQVLLAALED